MPSFGEKLKQEREKRKITLEQISVSTKIGTRMLQALEEDKFNQLPGGIFNKGFVRAYSRFVGLDEDQTVADYLQASGDAPPPPTEIAAPEEREPAENIRRMEATSSASRPVPWGWFAALLLIVALALSLWSRRWREHENPPARTTQTTPVVPAATSSSPSTTLDPASAAAPQDVRVDGAPKSSTPSSAGSTANTQSSTPQDPPVAPGEFVVDIQAHEESWVSFTADGKTHSSELLTPGSKRSVPARKEIVVKLGNAGGVDLSFNGKKVNSGGEFGEVKTVTFGPGGVVPNAPSTVSTP